MWIITAFPLENYIFHNLISFSDRNRTLLFGQSYFILMKLIECTILLCTLHLHRKGKLGQPYQNMPMPARYTLLNGFITLRLIVKAWKETCSLCIEILLNESAYLLPVHCVYKNYTYNRKQTRVLFFEFNEIRFKLEQL